MKSTALIFFGVVMSLTLAYAEPIQAPGLEPSINGTELASESLSSPEYAAAFWYGARYACGQSERATRRYANMLQANCIAADMGMDWGAILRHCIVAQQRSAFVRQAEETCPAVTPYRGALLAREGHSAQ